MSAVIVSFDVCLNCSLTFGCFFRALNADGPRVRVLGFLIRDRLVPFSDWDMSTRYGIPHAYRGQISDLGGGRAETALAGEVIHIRTASDAVAPWSGRSPLSRVSLSASLLAEVETALRDVYRDAPLGSQIAPVPEGSAEDMAELRSAFKGRKPTFT